MTMNKSNAVALMVVKAGFGMSLALGFGLGLSPMTMVAHADSGSVEEDSPQWSCVDDGNRVCGPGNSNGQPAGCYDDGGVLVAVWPCNPWTPDMGHRHADGTTTYPNGDVLTDDGESA